MGYEGKAQSSMGKNTDFNQKVTFQDLKDEGPVI